MPSCNFIATYLHRISLEQ